MYNEYLEFAKTLAREAGEIMRSHFLVTETEWKDDKTPLTIADTTINSLVIQKVQQAYPTHSVLGEEESLLQEGKYTWVCDPVDGTLQYAHGVPVSSFSIALCENGEPMVGVVYDPFMDRLFYAAKSSGAYCNDKKLTVNNGGMENAVINLEDVPSEKNIMKIPRLRDLLHEEGAKVVSLGSAILPAVLIASGQYSAVIFNFSKPEDGVAVKIIVEEAFGKVTDLFGNNQRYDQKTEGFIASNGTIHETLLKLVQEAQYEV
jgi:fructose-1,6-bisphosphatase/inositol monophosphatase family enzyme